MHRGHNPKKRLGLGLGLEEARQASWSPAIANEPPLPVVNMFQRWYRHFSFIGYSSHSGQRTFITNAAGNISTIGGSPKDVQEFAGHANLRTTQRHIEAKPHAQVWIVDLF
jgi:integrase